MKILLCLVFIVLLLVFSDSASSAALQALRIWGLDVAPSLFPYMVLSKTLASALMERNVPGVLCVWILGLLGGSPSGAAVIASVRTMPRRRLLALCALTGCISPMFLLHTVAQWSGDARFGRRLWLVHWLSAVLAYGAVLCLSGIQGSQNQEKTTEKESRSENPIAESVSSVLNVGGCIVFFSVMAASFNQMTPFLSPTMRAFIQGVLEASGGMHALLAAPISRVWRYTLCAGISGFGGFSILFQNYLFLKPLGVPFGALFSFSVLRALISAAAMRFILFFAL